MKLCTGGGIKHKDVSIGVLLNPNHGGIVQMVEHEETLCRYANTLKYSWSLVRFQLPPQFKCYTLRPRKLMCNSLRVADNSSSGLCGCARTARLEFVILLPSVKDELVL